MKIEKIFWNGNFEEAEEKEIEYYASLTWQESAKYVEELRRKIWGSRYPSTIEKIFRLSSLREDTDDIE